MSFSFLHKYIRWAIAGVFKNSVYYLMFLCMFAITENKHLSYWSWILMSPITYHIWKFVENHDPNKWFSYRRKI